MHPNQRFVLFLSVVSLLALLSAWAYASGSELLLRFSVLEPQADRLLQAYRSALLIMSLLLLFAGLIGGLRRRWRSLLLIPTLGISLTLAMIVFAPQLGISQSFQALSQLPRLAAGAIPLNDDSWVVGVTQGDESVAYPLTLLEAHIVINDQLAGEPTLVTYCRSCRSPIAYQAEIQGQALTFTVVGFHRVDAILEDQQTHSWWDEGTGMAVGGPLHGAQLTRIPATMVHWQGWRKLSPQTQIAGTP